MEEKVLTEECLILLNFENDIKLSKWYLKRNGAIVAPELYKDRKGFYIDCNMYPGLAINQTLNKRYIVTEKDLFECYKEAGVLSL